MDNTIISQAKKSLHTFLSVLIPVLCGIIVTWTSYISEFDRHEKELLLVGHQSVETFNRELTVRTQSLKALQLECEQYLNNLTQLTWNPAMHLKPVPEHQGYKLTLTNQYNSHRLGTLTGMGALPDSHSATVQEMGMALALTPLFQAIKERDPDTPWVYYTSAKGFLYLYPKEESKFFFHKEVFDADFYRGVTPAHNPDRVTYWTPKYLDLAGKGYMLTVSAPIYNGTDFLGAISIDISTNKLSWLLDRYTFPDSTAFLIDHNGELLIEKTGFDCSCEISSIQPGVFQRYGDYYYSKLPLSQTDWSLLIQTPVKNLTLSCLDKALPKGFVTALLLFCGILIFRLKQSMKEVTRLSTIDSLTGLYNRRQFTLLSPIAFDNWKRLKENIALLTYDLDDFKLLNDTYGHPVGDTVLIQVSQAVDQCLKRKNDYHFRVGGEEFIILVAISDQESLQQLAETIRCAVACLQIPNSNATIPFVTISIGGVYISKDITLSPEQAYSLSDKALYQAKQLGKNQVNILPG